MSKSKSKKRGRPGSGAKSALLSAAPVYIILPALCFLALCLSSASTVKTLSMLAAIAGMIAGVVRFGRLRERFHLPLLLLVLLVAAGGVSTIYAVSGKFALYEFLKLFFAFWCAVLFLALTPDDRGAAGRITATILEGGVAILGLVSVDLLSTDLIGGPVMAFIELFTQDYIGVSVLESGVRMTSLLGNPNVFAGCAGIGVLLSLGLAVSEEQRWRRNYHLCCLYVSALSFVLAFSLGASGTIALAFLVYLALERRERRASLLILMVETLLLCLVAAIPISMTSLESADSFQPIPLLCMIAGAALLCLSEQFAGRRIAEKLLGRGRVVLILVAVTLAAILGFALLAYNLTGPAELQAGEGLRRAAYPEPGSYSMSVQGSGAVSVRIESQNQQDTMMHTSTVIYSGPLSGAEFTVPEDSMVVYFNFTAAEPAIMQSVSYQGAGGSGEVPLSYTLLPGFIANRLQGLFANQNAIQRTVFFSDGMKLFMRSPVAGLGLGAFENGIRSVQSFDYETKYAHNHYIQVLAETGLIGFIFFVGLILVSAAAVLRSFRREDADPLVPALGAALVFMAGHAATEVVFSSYSYLILAFGVFALINLHCGPALSFSWFSEKVRRGVMLGAAALGLVFTVFLGLNMSAASLVERQYSLDSLARAASMDRFEWADYALSYVVVGVSETDSEVRAKSDDFALRLEKQDSNTIPYYLSDYYFTTGRMEKGFEMAEKYADYLASDANAWQQIFDVVKKYPDGSEAYRQGVLSLADSLDIWNAENMGTVALDAETVQFIAELREQEPA